MDASNNNVRPDQQAPRQASGSQTNPIDMITPSLNATPQLGHQPLVPNAFQTPVNQPTGLQPAAPIAERQNSRGQQQQQQQPAPPSQPTQQAQQAQQLAQQQAQQQAQLQQAQQQAQQHAQQLQQQSLVQQQQVAQQQQQLHLQQANQQVQQWQQQQALQAQQAQQQQQQGQLQPNDPSSQQFRSSPQSSGGVPSAVAKSKPWLAMDFSKENIPIKEEPFMIYLGNMHMKTNEPLPAPMIDGKPVNLFNLFGLIHRNGGSTRVGFAQIVSSVKLTSRSPTTPRCGRLSEACSVLAENKRSRVSRLGRLRKSPISSDRCTPSSLPRSRTCSTPNCGRTR